MLWRIFYVIIALCAALNATMDIRQWWTGGEASGWTWAFAILFSIGVFLDCVRNAIDPEKR